MTFLHKYWANQHNEPMDKLKAFDTFVSVATKGSLTAAARAEGVAPAIIGRRLDALEEALGVKLLVRTTRRPQEFFNTASLIAPRINLRLYNAMPGYLISLGLFFTFIGLVAAIAIAAKGLAEGTNIDQTQAALVQLLDVASLKFISSVAGIGLSIILSFVQKAWLNRTSMMIHDVCLDLEARTQLVTTEQLLHQWLLAQQQAARGQSYMAEDIATEVVLQLSRVNA